MVYAYPHHWTYGQSGIRHSIYGKYQQCATLLRQISSRKAILLKWLWVSASENIIEEIKTELNKIMRFNEKICTSISSAAKDIQILKVVCSEMEGVSDTCFFNPYTGMGLR